MEQATQAEAVVVVAASATLSKSPASSVNPAQARQKRRDTATVIHVRAKKIVRGQVAAPATASAALFGRATLRAALEATLFDAVARVTE